MVGSLSHDNLVDCRKYIDGFSPIMLKQSRTFSEQQLFSEFRLQDRDRLAAEIDAFASDSYSDDTASW